jgi:hypothetical protein
MKKLRIDSFFVAVVLIYIFTPSYSFAHDKAFPADKLKALYPEAISFEQKAIHISDQQRSRIKRQLKAPLPEEDLNSFVYFVIAKQNDNTPPRKVAVVIFTNAYGDGGEIELGVVVGRKGELMKIRVFENNEAEILSSHSFLKQFKGKISSDAFKVGIDMTSPPNEKRSTKAIASGARRGLLIINELLRKK